MTQATANRKPTSRKRNNVAKEAGRQFTKVTHDQLNGNKLEYLAKTLDAFGALERIAEKHNATETEGQTLPAAFLAYLARLDRDDVKSVFFQEPFRDVSTRPFQSDWNKSHYRHCETKSFSIGWKDPKSPGREKRFRIRIEYCEVEKDAAQM